jgi:predicted RNase H-like nuclease (RuvC/YqgF family)
MPEASGDSKKKEFHHYLEQHGVIECLTKMLVAIFELPEKPNNSSEVMEYLSMFLNGDRVAELEKELEEKNKKIEELQNEVNSLKEAK